MRRTTFNTYYYYIKVWEKGGKQTDRGERLRRKIRIKKRMGEFWRSRKDERAKYIKYETRGIISL